MQSETWVPTVDDLRVKLCYICREEERFDNPEEPRRAWTHPCNCTLVAHESCLLHWIRAAQQDPSRAKNALKCPQCGAIYELESDNPFVLKLLDNVNASLSLVGKVVSIAGLTAVIISFGFGVYIICTSYGSYAMKEFLGKEIYDLLLSDDPSNWPWHAFINLPLIPFSLVFSRTRMFDVLPIVPLFLAWTSSPPVPTTQNMITARWNLSGRRNELYPSAPLLTWPPPPIIVTSLYPFLVGLYRRGFERLKHRVMGTQPSPRPTVRRIIWGLNEEGPGPFRLRIGANIEPGPEQRRAEQEAQGEQAPQQGGENQDQIEADAQADDPAAVAERTMRVSNASLGRFIGGALMMPAISNFMGSILLRLAKHSQILRKVLAIRPPLSRASLFSPGGWFDNQPWNKMSYTEQASVGLKLALNLVAAGTRTWAECDPVWWRNSIGLGLFIVAKDCIKLLHLWLAKRELETRRVKNRSFAGVDIRELELIHPPPTFL